MYRAWGVCYYMLGFLAVSYDVRGPGTGFVPTSTTPVMST